VPTMRQHEAKSTEALGNQHKPLRSCPLAERNGLIIAGLVLLTILVYLPSLGSGFVLRQ
jgi:hypothetical protein